MKLSNLHEINIHSTLWKVNWILKNFYLVHFVTRYHSQYKPVMSTSFRSKINYWKSNCWQQNPSTWLRPNPLICVLITLSLYFRIKCCQNCSTIIKEGFHSANSVNTNWLLYSQSWRRHKEYNWIIKNPLT